MAREKLGREALAGLDGWSLAEDGGSIARSFTFSDFSEAFAFMTRVAWRRRRSTITPTGRTSTTR
ncbi:4a-hydroxytetrahydrobiopterin dehydratase [Mesorhizobium sp.]|uniref:4a-hydroxytetrahydrobiopterin dehydratase n=1 Tax=Mesorhizobium sp. TaxID=1871066 RepID=UPI00257CDE2F|nr:4a-hydroxytetrahydrobiopterin dehydratase [Mesorhizobium sp.]